jgi:HEAT repeat protein
MGLFDRFKKSPAPAGLPDIEVQVLITKLTAADWKTRFDAARQLGELGERALIAVPALEEATCDDNNEVCTSAADALSAIRRATQ